MAFDYGVRRVGVAIGNTETASASPLTTIDFSQNANAWMTIDDLIKEWRPAQLVIGKPFNMDGSDSAMTTKAMSFKAQLEQRYELPITAIDERLTSNEAEDILREQRQSGIKKHRIKKGDVDSLAACLILQSFFNEQPES
ncbi:MAG: Holliday junction resolvase RuvX [Gammaproteobacteria bacterium]|nr:Holliday junction resolvase RuvX [Gammaproteobacteria bacterium]